MNPETQLATIQPKAVVITNERGVQFQTLGQIQKFAEVAVNSGIYKDLADNPAIAIIKIQAGLELGLTPVWALTNIMVVNGRPAVWGDALLGIVLANPQCEDVIETHTGKWPNDDYTATCEVRRKGRLPVIREFSVADAKRAGIFGKNVHAQYGPRMQQMRARSWACRDAFADALRGLAVREEMETVSEPKRIQAREVATGLVLPDEPEPVTQEPPQPAIEPSDNDGGERPLDELNPDGTFKL